jgi:hypothetical protein
MATAKLAHVTEMMMSDVSARSDVALAAYPAAGRSSANPATADKAKKKKRGKRTRLRRKGVSR